MSVELCIHSVALKSVYVLLFIPRVNIFQVRWSSCLYSKKNLLGTGGFNLYNGCF